MKTYFTVCLSLIIGFAVTAQDKLITIYSDDCSYCDQLLNITYQNNEVKKELEKYKVEFIEANSKEGKEYIMEYNISKFPTQIAIYELGKTILGGYVTIQQEIKFLQNPQRFIQSNDTVRVRNRLFSLTSSKVINDGN
jgi:hypothetical protein